MESELGRVVDALPGLVWTARPDGQIDSINQRWTEFTGLAVDRSCGHAWQDAIHPEDLPGLLAGWRSPDAAGAPVEAEARLRGADGKYRWFLFRAHPLADASGRVVKWCGLSTDIEEQKQAKTLLAGDKQLLEMIASGRPMAEVLEALCRLVEGTASGSYCSIVLVDPGGTKLQEAIAPSLPAEFNDAVRDWPLDRLGGPCQRAARDKIQVIMSDVVADTRWRNGWRTLAQKHGLKSCWSTPIVSRAGKVLGTFALYQRDAGNPSPLQLELIAQFIGIASIAIERARRDAALRQSESRLADAERELQLMIDTIPAYVTVFGPDGEREYVNKTWRDNTGLQLADIQNGGWRKIVHPDDQERSDRIWREAVASGKPIEIRQRIRRHDGTYRWHLGRRTPLRDELGRILRWYSVAIDIEDQERAERALRDSERNARLIVDSIPGLVAILAPDGRFERVNRQMSEYFGSTLEDLTLGRRTTRDGVHPDDLARITRVFKQSIASGEPFEFEMRCRRFDGVWRWLQSRGYPLRDDNGRIIRWHNLLIDIDERKRAEEALRQSEVRLAAAERDLQQMIDTIPVFVAAYEPDGTRIFVNKTWQEYMGLPLAEAIGPSARAFPHFHPDNADANERVWRASLASGETLDLEVRVRRADGQYRWHSTRRVPLRDDEGNIVRWYSVGIDIDDQKTAEDALRGSESQLAAAKRELQATIDAVPALVASYWPNGERDFVNLAWQNFTGISQEEARGQKRMITVHPDARALGDSLWQRSLETGEPFELEERLQNAEGKYRWHWVRRVPARDENGKIIKWYGVGHDIDERKRAEQALRQSEARIAETERELRLTLDSIPTITWKAGANGYVQQLNKRWFEYTGTTAEQVHGWRWKLCVHPDDLDRLIEIGSQYVASGVPIDAEARLRRFDGEYRWFLFRPAPVRDEAGTIVAWYGTISDIEDRRRAEEKAVEAERELQRTIDNIPVLVGTYSADGKRLSVNRRALEVTGLRVEDVPDKRWEKQAFHPDEIEAIEHEWQMCLESGEPFERETRTRVADGSYRWQWTRRVPLRDETGTIVRWYGVGYDIEDQKRAEQGLAASERNLKLAIDTTPALIWWTRADGGAETVNRHYLDYVGLSLDQVQGWGWTQAVHPDDLPGLASTWQGVMATGKGGEAEARLRRNDGQYRWFLFRANALRDDNGNIIKWYGVNTDIEDRKRAEEALRRSEAFLSEGQRVSSTGTFSWRIDSDELTFSDELYRIFEIEQNAPVTFQQVFERVHPEDRSVLSERMKLIRGGRTPVEQEVRLLLSKERVKYMRSVGQMIRHPDGRREYFGAVQDVTQRRLAEQAVDKVRTELAHVTRIMSLGALTASIAHEVNQPLAGIITNASTCLRMLGADPPNIDGARETARRTIRDGNRAADVITRLRALFSKNAGAAETVDLNEAAREVLALVFSDLLRNRVVLRVEVDDDHPLLITGDRVQLQQVILNLVRNASDAMSSVTDRPRHLLVRTDQDEEGRARLTVKDSGVGLSPQNLERLFDAFFTTKNDGMGIGLSVSRSIIESHGGKLWAEPNDGPGATFAFFIPQHTESAGDESVTWTRPTRGATDLMRKA